MRHIRSQWFRRKEQERKRRAYFRHDVGKFKREIFNYEACESSFLSHDQSETRYSRSSGKRRNLHKPTSYYRSGDNESEYQNRDHRLVNFDDTGSRYRERYKDVFDVNYSVEVASEVCFQKHDQNEWIRKSNYFGQLSDSNLTSKSDSRNENDFQRVKEENCVRNYERSISHITNEGRFDQHYENRLKFESHCPNPEFSECFAEKMHYFDFPCNTKEEISSFNDKDCRQLLSGKTDFPLGNDFKFRYQSLSTIGIETVGHERFLDDSAWQQNQSLPMAIDWRQNQSLPTSDSVTGQFDSPTHQPPLLPLSVALPYTQWTVPTLHPSSITLPMHDQSNNYQQACTNVQNTLYSFQNKRQDPPYTNLPHTYPHAVTNISTEIVKQENIQNKRPGSKQTNCSLTFVSNSALCPPLNVNGKDYFETHQEQKYACTVLPERGTSNKIGYHDSTESWNNTCHTAVYTQRNSPMSVMFQDDKTMALQSKSTDLFPNLSARQSNSVYCSSLASESGRVIDFQDTSVFSNRDKVCNKECIEKKNTQADVKPCKRRWNENEVRDKKRYHGVHIEEEKSCQDWACAIDYNESIEGSCLKGDQNILESSKHGTQAGSLFSHSFSGNCDSSNFDKHRLPGTKNTKENIFRPWTSSLEYDHEEISATNSSIDCNSRKNLQDTNFRTDQEERQSKQGEEYRDRKQSSCTNSTDCKKENALYKVNHQNLKMRDLKNFVHSKLKPTVATECSESSASPAAFASHQKSNEKLQPSGKDTIMKTWSESYIKKPEVGVLERSQKGLNQNRLNTKNNPQASSKGKKSFDSKQVENQEALSPSVKTDQKKNYTKSKQKRKIEFGADMEKKPYNSNIHPKLRHKINSQVAPENETLTSLCGITNTVSNGKLRVKSSKNSHCAEGDMIAHKSPSRRQQSKIDKTSKTTIETLNKRKHSALFQNPPESKPNTKHTTDRVSTESSFDKIHTLEGKHSHSFSVAGHIKSDGHSNNQVEKKLGQSIVAKKKNTNRNVKENQAIKLKAIHVKSMKSADAPVTNPDTKFTLNQSKNSTSIKSDILSSQVPVISSTYHEPYRIENPKVREMKYPKEDLNCNDHRYSGPINERTETTSVETERAESNKKKENFVFRENNSVSSDLIVDVPSSDTDSEPTVGEKNLNDLRRTEETPEKNDNKLSVVSNSCNNSCNSKVNRTLNHPSFSVRYSTDKNDNCIPWPDTSLTTPVPFDAFSYSQNRVYPEAALPIRERPQAGCPTLPFSMNMKFNFASDLHLKYVKAKRELEVIDSRRPFLLPLSGQVKDQLSSVSSSGVTKCPCKTEVTEKKGKYEAYSDKAVELRQNSPAQKKLDDYKKVQWHKCLEVNSPSVHCSHEKLDSVVENRSQRTIWIHDTDQVKEESTRCSNTACSCDENLSDFVGLSVPFECDSTTQTIDEVINIDAHTNTSDYENENGIHRVIEQVITEKCLCSTNSPEIIDDLSWISDERLDEIANCYDGLGSDVSDNKESVDRDTNYRNTTPSRSPFRVSTRRRHRYSKRFPTGLPRMKKEKCQSEKALYESAVKFLGDFDKTNKRACRQAKQVEEPKVVTKKKNVSKKDCSPKSIDGKNELTKGNTYLNSKIAQVKEYKENLKTDLPIREYTGSVLLKNNENEENPRKVVEKLKIADLLSKYKLKVGKLEKGKLVSMRQHFDKRSRTNIAGRKEIDTICNKTPVVKMENLSNRKKFAVEKEPNSESIEKHKRSENIKLYDTCRVCKMSVYTNMQYHFQRFHRSWCFRCQKDFKEFDLMRRHIRRNHDIPIFCGLCGVTFLYKSSYNKHCNTTLHQENTKKNPIAKQVSSKPKIGTAKNVTISSSDGKSSDSASALNISTPGSKDVPSSLGQNADDLESKPVKNSAAPSLAVKKTNAKLKFCEVCKKFYKMLHAHMKTEKHLQNMKTQKQEARRKKIQAKLMLH